MRLFEISDLIFEIWDDLRLEIWYLKFEIWDDLRLDIWELDIWELEIWDLKFETRDLRFKIWD